MTDRADERMRRNSVRAAGLPAIACAASLALSGCSVQFTPPYDEVIEKETDSLKTDFLRFVAERQRTAGTPKGYYVDHQAAYDDFAARLAAMELRSEDQPGGVSCARAAELAKNVTNGITSFNLGNAVPQSAASNIAGNVSCATAEIRNAQDQIARFRTQDEKRCAKGSPPVQCTTLFGTVPVGRVAASLRSLPGATAAATDEEESTLVKAVLISLDNLEGLEQDLKPASGGK
jgi:hypothetical protein